MLSGELPFLALAASSLNITSSGQRRLFSSDRRAAPVSPLFRSSCRARLFHLRWFGFQRRRRWLRDRLCAPRWRCRISSCRRPRSRHVLRVQLQASLKGTVRALLGPVVQRRGERRRSPICRWQFKEAFEPIFSRIAELLHFDKVISAAFTIHSHMMMSSSLCLIFPKPVRLGSVMLVISSFCGKSKYNGAWYFFLNPLSNAKISDIIPKPFEVTYQK